MHPEPYDKFHNEDRKVLPQQGRQHERRASRRISHTQQSMAERDSRLACHILAPAFSPHLRFLKKESYVAIYSNIASGKQTVLIFGAHPLHNPQPPMDGIRAVRQNIKKGEWLLLERLKQVGTTDHVCRMRAGVEQVTVLPAEVTELLDFACRNFFLARHLGHQSQQRVLGLTECLHRVPIDKVGDVFLAQAEFG